MEERTVDFFFGGIIGFFAWFFGGIDGFLIVLITLCPVDLILGILNKYLHHEHSMQQLMLVLSRKTAEFCFVGIAHIVDQYMLGGTATFRTAVTLFYIVIEWKSIMEHTEALELPMPQVLKKNFSELEKKLGDDENINADYSKELEEKKVNDTNNIDTIYTRIFDEGSK